MRLTKQHEQHDGLSSWTTLIRAAHLTKMLQISNATLWRWTKAHTRGFPQPIRIGQKITAWRLAEIEQFITNQVGKP